MKLSTKQYGKIAEMARALEQINGVPVLQSQLSMWEALKAQPVDVDAMFTDYAQGGASWAHDMGGIHAHLNHATGELENCFMPRFALEVTA